MSSWGAEAVGEHNRRLSQRVADGAEALGLRVAPAALRAPHLLGLRLDPTVDAEALAPALADDAVHVSVRGDAIRVSVHAFNNDADVDHLLDALGRRLGRRP